VAPDRTTRINLPAPEAAQGMPLAEAISKRRSTRDFSPEPLTQLQLSQLLWSAQGVTETEEKLRAVPSAGATYPLEIFAVCGPDSLESAEAGIYHYEVKDHSLIQLAAGDFRADLAGAALNQKFIYQAPVDLVICAELSRTLMRYSARGEMYVYVEVGHAGQNIYLQATAIGLATVAVGAFNDEHVREVLQLKRATRPIYIMPVGKAG
jgi:SagB-type dehydrogenase family enzyme